MVCKLAVKKANRKKKLSLLILEKAYNLIQCNIVVGYQLCFVALVSTKLAAHCTSIAQDTVVWKEMERLLQSVKLEANLSPNFRKF